MLPPLRVAQCCDTCRHFWCESGYRVGYCRLRLAWAEEQHGNMPKEEIASAIYTSRSMVCDAWEEPDGRRSARSRKAIFLRSVRWRVAIEGG